MPALSTARTLKVWLPWPRPWSECGDWHAWKEPPSSLHSKVEPLSEAAKANVAEVDLTVPEGPEVIVVLGRTVSTVHARSAGVGSLLPARSTALTLKVWPLLESPV